MTGFSPEQVAGILQREGGICAMSGALNNGTPLPQHKADTANHRLNRGIGGDPTRNGTENGCAICNDCNTLIERDPEYAAAARHRGVKLREGDRPDLIPLWCVFYAQWVRLVGDVLTLTGERNSAVRPEFTDDSLPRLEHVPTVEELAAQGLARSSTGNGGVTQWTLEPAGQERIYAAQRRNADLVAQHPELAADRNMNMRRTP